MRFGNSSGPPPWLNRRDQMRMLALVGLLAMVLVAIQIASRPQTWRWMFPEQARSGSVPAGSQRESEPSVQPGPRNGGLRDDEVFVEPQKAAPEEPDDREDAADPLNGTSATHVTDASPGRSAPRSARRESPLRIPPELLEDVRDDYVGLRASESDTYHLTLARARQIAPARLREAARRNVDFALLMDDPDQFRGRPITVAGHLRGLTRVPAGENPFGIQAVYDAWVFPPEAGNNPYCIRCVEIDESLPLTSPIEQVIPVQATGFFFKRLGYAAAGSEGRGDVFHVAPLVLARRLERVERTTEPPAQRDRGLTPYLIALAATIGALLVMAVVWFRISDRRFESSHLKRLSTAPREAIESLDGIETTDPEELFRRMSQEARAGDDSGSSST